MAPLITLYSGKHPPIRRFFDVNNCPQSWPTYIKGLSIIYTIRRGADSVADEAHARTASGTSQRVHWNAPRPARSNTQLHARTQGPLSVLSVKGSFSLRTCNLLYISSVRTKLNNLSIILGAQWVDNWRLWLRIRVSSFGNCYAHMQMYHIVYSSIHFTSLSAR